MSGTGLPGRLMTQLELKLTRVMKILVVCGLGVVLNLLGNTV